MRQLILFFGIILSSSLSCSKNTVEDQKLRDKFVNVLDICKIPKSKHNLDAFGFSDQGAWHAYSLPHPDSSKYHAGFCGPLMMKNHGTWLGKSTGRLSLYNSENQPIPFELDSQGLAYFPGKLEQRLSAVGLKLIQGLIFTDERNSMFSYEIFNNGKSPLEMGWKLSGSYFPQNQKTYQSDQHVFTILPDSSFLCYTMADKHFILDADTLGIEITGTKKIQINPGESYRFVFLESYFFNREEYDLSKIKLKGFRSSRDSVFSENSARWEKWLKNGLNSRNPLIKDTLNQRLAVKCLLTLVSNWRSPAGALKHHGLFPSAAYQGFYGFWSWDSWKHAVALVQFSDFLAKESIRSMFDFQDKHGMVADCVYNDSTENNWRDTKPPLAAWAVWKVFEKTRDSSFVIEMYPKLKKYHEWWYNYRDINKNGMCEYGSTDGTLIAAKWESGMDNAVRFDQTTLHKKNDFAWSMNQESVDLNVFLQKEKEYLALLAFIAGKKDDAQKFSEEAINLSEKIINLFWSKEESYFFDFNFEKGVLIKTYGPEGWLPMWTGLATEEQARGILDRMMDTMHFNTRIPLPTLSRSDHEFNPLKGYWRGPVWLDQFYFGIKGLEIYGYQSESDELKRKLFRNAEGLMNDKPIRENYHPLTGEGLNANHFSWSAAHLLLLLTE